jgi:hypothetical protein
VEPSEVCSVLAHLDATGAPELLAHVEAALSSRSGAEAASALMAPVAAAFKSIEPRERGVVLDAIDALIRAGGDPTPVLPALARGLEDGRTVEKACVGLHRAALAGHSIASVWQQLSKAATGTPDGRVRSVERLAALQQRGLHADLRRLGTVYEQQRPIGNLHGGIGVLEESLLSGVEEEVALARRALAELERAGADSYLGWIALLPVLSEQVRAPDRERCARAAAALAQIEYAVSRSVAFEPREAAERALPLLRPALDGLTALLGSEGAESAIAARTIQAFVDIGCPLGDLRPRLEAALDAPRVDVRSAASRAVSADLQRAGTEARLPRGRSHRRTYASADTPLVGRETVRCPSCGGKEAAVIYESRDRGNTWDETTCEIRCPACRVYAVELFGP